MAQQTVNIGAAANDGTGTTLRAGGQIINENFSELYGKLANLDVGSGTELQYKNGSVLGAIAGSGWDGTTLTLPKILINQSPVIVRGTSGSSLPMIRGSFDATYHGDIVFADNDYITLNRHGEGTSIWLLRGPTPGICLGYGSKDVELLRSSAYTLYQRNGTNPQTYLLSGTYTDINNYRRLYIKANDASGDFRIGVEGAGTGANGNKVTICGGSGETVSISNGFTTVTATAGGVVADFLYGTNGKMRLVYNGLQLAGDYPIAWGSNTSYFGSPDAGVNRSIAGRVEVNNGTTGTYRDLILRSLFFTKTSAPADAELAASQCCFWLEDTNGAGKLKIKAKTANGTVVTGELALT